jgi:hypothetical protein
VFEGVAMQVPFDVVHYKKIKPMLVFTFAWFCGFHVLHIAVISQEHCVKPLKVVMITFDAMKHSHST